VQVKPLTSIALPPLQGGGRRFDPYSAHPHCNRRDHSADLFFPQRRIAAVAPEIEP
jgi:hypothetical protein